MNHDQSQYQDLDYRTWNWDCTVGDPSLVLFISTGLLFLTVCGLMWHAGFIGSVLGGCITQHGDSILTATRKHNSTSPLSCLCSLMSLWLHRSSTLQQVHFMASTYIFIYIFCITEILENIFWLSSFSHLVLWRCHCPPICTLGFFLEIWSAVLSRWYFVFH